MAGKKGMRHYNKEVKLQAVQMFLGGGKTYAEITEELGIRDPQRIEKWVRHLRSAGGGTGLEQTERAAAQEAGRAE